MEGSCTDRPLPQKLISKTVCDGTLFGYKSKRLSVPQTETSPWAEFARGSDSKFTF